MQTQLGHHLDSPTHRFKVEQDAMQAEEMGSKDEEIGSQEDEGV